MNIPKPHTLLASLAITTLLLTACGSTQQAANLPTPETSSSATADPTATATDTASSSATTDPAQASASPSLGYSGGSKAPEGEYRAADEHGPAQNVPKPVAPAGMNVESPEALFLFIEYWNELRNYALQTGDVEEIITMVDESFIQEQKFYSALARMYEYDGWVIGGGRTIHLNKDLFISHGSGEYSLGANFEVKDSIFWLGGEASYNDNSGAINDGVEIKFRFTDGKWKVLSADVVN